MKLDEVVGNYIKLRDMKAKMKADYEGKVASVQDLMDKMEAKLLQVFRDSGLESVKTPFGTAYTSTRTSATVADRDAFLAFVREKEAWEMLENRCCKAAVEQYKAANNDLPPGLNWREEQVVNVRRGA